MTLYVNVVLLQCSVTINNIVILNHDCFSATYMWISVGWPCSIMVWQSGRVEQEAVVSASKKGKKLEVG